MRERKHILEVNESELRLLNQSLKSTRSMMETMIDTFPGVHSALGDKIISLTRISDLLYKVQHAPRDDSYVPDYIPAVVMLDAEGRVALWGPMASKMLGWPEDEIVGFHPVDSGLIDEAQASELGKALATSMKLDEWVLCKVDARHKDGHIVPIRARLRQMEISQQDFYAIQIWPDPEENRKMLG